MSKRVPRGEVEEMYRAYVDGQLTLDEVGRLYGRGASRVGELFRREGLPGITSAQRGAAQTVAQRRERGDSIAGAIASYGPEYLAECLAMAAAEDGGETMSVHRYRELSTEWGLPSPPRLIQVFGSWREACRAAGLRPNQGRGSYARRFAYEDALGAVRACAAELGHPPSVRQYERWQKRARPAPGKGGPYPSAAHARTMSPDKRWTRLLRDALG